MGSVLERPKVNETAKEPYMARKRTILSLLTLATAALVTASIASASSSNGATLLIRHQTRGCHSWALNGGAFKPNQSISFVRGATLTITNTDVMPHTFVQLSGPSALLKHPAMSRMGAVATVTFGKSGTYRFTTKAGEDYMAGVKTIGPDNILTLVVHVR